MKGSWVTHVSCLTHFFLILTLTTNFNINYLEVSLLNFFLKSQILYGADLGTKCFAFFHICRGRRNRWPVASIFTVGPVKLNKDRPAGPVDILGPLGPATFVSSVSFNID